MNKPEPYSTGVKRIGLLKRQKTTVAYMPKSDFVELNEKLLASYPMLDDELRPVIRRMNRFPLRTWIHEERGCGCVVGEYLIAANLITRESVATGTSVLNLLQEQDNGNLLINYGDVIDREVRDELSQHLATWDQESQTPVEAVVFI